jgi:hypothetical protein
MMIIILFQAIDEVPHTLLLNKLNHSDYLHLMLCGSKATYYIDLPLFVSQESFILLSLYCREYHSAVTLAVSWLTCLLTTFLLKSIIPNFCYLQMI